MLVTIWLMSSLWCFGQQPDSMRIYTRVDHMPQLLSCASGYGNMYKLDRCTVASLKAWMSSNMQYPSDAIQAAKEERFTFMALIDTTGQLKEIKPLQDLSSECGKEADRLVNLMMQAGDKWTAGRQGKNKVPVWIEFCVEFNIRDWNNELARRANPQAFARQDSIALMPVKPELPKPRPSAQHNPAPKSKHKAVSKSKHKVAAKAGKSVKRKTTSKSKHPVKKSSKTATRKKR